MTEQFIAPSVTAEYEVVTAASRARFNNKAAAFVSAARMLEVADWVVIENTQADGYVRKLRMAWS